MSANEGLVMENFENPGGDAGMVGHKGYGKPYNLSGVSG